MPKLLLLVLLAQMLFYPGKDGTSMTWQVPKPGSLYILDSSGPERKEAHVLLVDPEAGTVLGTITTGEAPDMTVSPDGSHLFVISGPVDHSIITAYDARSGTASASTDVLWRVLTTTWPSAKTLAVSGDGRWLFVETMHTLAEGSDEYALSRFDVGHGGIVPAGRVELPECGLADITPEKNTKWDVLVHCPFGNSLRRVKFTDGAAGYVDLTLPSRPYDPASGQMEHRALGAHVLAYKGSGEQATVLMGSNELCKLDLEGGVGPCSKAPNRMNGRWILQRPATYSSDGRFLYFASGPIVNRSTGLGTAIEIFDSSTLTYVASIDASVPFWSFAIDSRSQTLYVASPPAHTVVEIDLATRQEVKEISLPQSHPSRVVPMP